MFSFAYADALKRIEKICKEARESVGGWGRGGGVVGEKGLGEEFIFLMWYVWLQQYFVENDQSSSEK